MVNIFILLFLLFPTNRLDAQENILYDSLGNVIGILNLEDIDTNHYCIQEYKLEGKIKKVLYEDDELTILGLIIEKNNGIRESIYLNKNYLLVLFSGKWYKELYTFLRVGENLFFDCNICGSGEIHEIINIYENPYTKSLYK